MDNELSCPVCGEAFGGDSHKPRMLNCGHTHCTSCLTTLFRAHELLCPECRTTMTYTKVGDVPINFFVVRLITKGDGIGLGLLQNIKDRFENRHKELKAAAADVKKKLTYHETQIEYLNNLFEKYEKQTVQLEDWLLSFKTIEAKLKSAASTSRLAEAAKEISESFQIIGNCLSEDIEISEAEEKESNEPTVCDLQNLTIAFTGASNFYACQELDNSTRWARVTLHKDLVHLHVLQGASPPSGALKLKYEDVRVKVPSEATLAFFEVWWSGVCQGYVYLRTFDCLLTREFLKLCSGEAGPSYKDTCFYAAGNIGKFGERIQGGDYINNTGEDNEFEVDIGSEILNDIPITAGLLTNYGSKFKIFLSDWPDRTDCLAHGHVESGLPLLKAAARHDPITDVVVKDCGLAFPFSC